MTNFIFHFQRLQGFKEILKKKEAAIEYVSSSFLAEEQLSAFLPRTL